MTSEFTVLALVGRVGETTLNAFAEPQYTVYEYDEQVPHWQIFAGVNLQF